MDAFNSFTGTFTILAVALVVFLIFRFLVLWYFRINKIVYELQQTNYILKQLFIQAGGSIEDVEEQSNDPLFKSHSK